jgi:hypothetical protein
VLALLFLVTSAGFGQLTTADIVKNFPITERVNLQFRAEAFNISNTPSFFIANTNSSNQQLGSGNFGSITQTDPNYNPRQYQFALKANF